MSVKKFKFVSPGIFVNEVDNSQLPKLGDEVGPVIIGRTLRGPAMRPVQIQSFSDFVETFGEPVAGGIGGDIWRDGNRLGPTYAAYAAQAYLRNASPITFVRLLGEDHPDAATTAQRAGWSVGAPSATWSTKTGATGTTGAYGLFVANGASGAVAAKGSVEFNTVVIANAGFNVQYDGGSAVTEASGTHPAFSIDVTSNNGGNDTLTMTHFDGDTSSLVLGDAAGKQVVGGGAAVADQRNNLVSYINTNFPELEAVGDSVDVSKLYVREKTRIKVAGAGSVNVSFIAGANNLTVLEGSSSAFCNFSSGVAADVFSAGAYSGVAETGASTISLAKAMEDAGISPFHSFTGSASVDANLATQFAALGSFGANTLAVDSTDVTKVVVTSTAAGAAGNGVVVAGSVGTVSGTNTSGGVTSSLTMDAALAAILYVKDGGISLVGENAGEGSIDVDGLGCWVKSDGGSNQFKLKVRGSGSAKDTDVRESIAFNFDKNSRLYIRDVLNTNPTLCNGEITEDEKKKPYWLGGTFDQHLSEVQEGVSTGAGLQYACLIALEKAENYESSMAEAKSPWVISQHNGKPSEYKLDDDLMLIGSGGIGANAAKTVEDFGVEKLFRFHSLYSGEWERKNLKITIYDIKAPTDKLNPYGTFSVMIRKSDDTDASKQIVERYSSCSLNPASANFIARKIGDMKSVWDDDDRRYVEHGLYPNQSRFVRVELASSVEAGSADPRLIPFGFLGPRRRSTVQFTTNASSVPQAVTVRSPSGASAKLDAASGSAVDPTKIMETANKGGVAMFGSDDNKAEATLLVDDNLTLVNAAGNQSWTINMKFPKMNLRTSSRDATLSSPKDACWGISTNEFGSSTIFDPSYGDIAGWCAHGIEDANADGNAPEIGGVDEFQFIFSLDDIKYAAGPDSSDGNRAKPKPRNFEWVPGCHARDYASGGAINNAGTDATACSITAYEGLPGTSNGTYDDASRPRSYTAVLDAGVDQFTMPLVGGHDGLDILEIEPFGYHSNSASTTLPTSSQSVLEHYALNSLKKAVDTVSDPEVVEMNMLAAPGMTHPSITSHMVSVCESRGDALAIIDIDKDYQPRGLDKRSEADRMPNVDKAIADMRERAINSSYGCAFFPWLQYRDSMSGRVLWGPPSVAAIGTMASSTRKSELWFAPAGFTRGGLTDGAAGVGVSSVRLRLNSKERDKLYEANINPIAQFPAEGIVIFGQKTLQITPSALDRINVRRLMIYLKKEISRMAKTVLFDQNVSTTWARFVSKADPFLASVKGRFGLTEYKIVLDETTTTAELIDRNIMYAKIFLKPAKAIEFIAIDFVITDSGASFDD